jgi:glutathione S-transferase
MGDDSPTYTLINATPSPYGRKNSIAMYEKGINFEVRWEKPWEPETIVMTTNTVAEVAHSFARHGNSCPRSTYILTTRTRIHCQL